MEQELIDPRHLLLKIVEILERLRIPYAVTGGMAVFVWGRPRFTADIDIIVLLDSVHISKLTAELKNLSAASYLDQKAIDRAFERRGEFNFIDGSTGIKVDFWVLGRKLFAESQLRRRVIKEILSTKVYFIAPEDLVLNKLLWYKDSESSKQLEDIESILKIQKKLDWKYLRKWAKEQSTIKILENLWKKNKKI